MSSNPSLPAYQPPAGGADEMIGADGHPRAHWQGMLDALRSLGPEGMLQRWESARRLIHENGVTYNVYGDPQGLERPWELDAVPLIIPPDEWRHLEAGLIQRAQLLNMLLADIYGEQRLLHQRVIPPALVLANPRFLRPCRGLNIPHNTYLHLYAADLARSPDGGWWVLSDRSQAPSGAGYALENRIVVSRSLPNLFRDSHVQRLAGYFQRLRTTLAELASRSDDPRIVLLTPGPYNETYFEHAYLARYLGYTLTEGEDLTVRDGRVYLKTLGGLQPVDVILRRLDDDYADPLELRSDSALGIPGLLQAVRNGTVVIANALGSGVVECAGLMGALPALSRHLLDEPLKLPSLPSWWCGADADRAQVLNKLDRLLIQPTFQSRTLLTPPGDTIDGAKLSTADRAQLANAIKANGYRYVAQEPVPLSTVPVWDDGKLTPRAMTFRAFVVAHGDGGYSVMPGGLTRVGGPGEVRAISSQAGGSKDTWVLNAGPVDPFSLLRSGSPAVAVRRTGADLPSRVAESLFWLGRYAERAETEMRILRAVLTRMGEEAGFGGLAELAALIRMMRWRHQLTLVQSDRILAELDQGEGRRRLAGEMATLMFDPNRVNGLRDPVGHVTRIASVVRDRLSLDAWRTLNQLNRLDELRLRDNSVQTAEALVELNTLILTMSAFSGMEMENMTRGQGWRFLDMGRRIERAMQTVSLLQGATQIEDTESEGVLDVLLELADSFMTYRSRYFIAPRLAPVVDLLLLDDSNPRSVGFQFAALDRHAEDLPRTYDRNQLSSEQRLIIAHRTELRLADGAQLCASGPGASRPGLDALLQRLHQALPELSETLSRTYFAHATTRRHDGGLRRGDSMA